MRRAMATIGFAALITLTAGSSAAIADTGPRPEGGFDHVFVIMMENTSYSSLIGNSNAPWINQAAQTYGLAKNYYGVTHPSQPNYIAATSGSTNGVADDNDITIDVPNIVDQLESHDRTWKAYMQSYSLCTSPTAHACGNQLYERKHNPFISYADVQNNTSRVANIVDFSQLATDLSSGNVPNYVWISPDQCHDMHGRFSPTPDSDPCAFKHVQSLISTGDTFLSDTVSAIMSSSAWTEKSVIFVTWDESDFTGTGSSGFGDTSGCCDAKPGGGHVLTIVISHSEQPLESNHPFNHYSMLRTIQDGWDLGHLGFTGDGVVQPMFTLIRTED